MPDDVQNSDEESMINDANPQENEAETHGIAAKDETKGIGEEKSGEEESEIPKSSSGNENSTGEGNWNQGSVNEDNHAQEKKSKQTPNPFDNPGDSEKFWHEKLNIIENEDESGTSETENYENDEADGTDDANING